MSKKLYGAAFLLFAAFIPAAANAQQCEDSRGFKSWLGDMEQAATSAGVSEPTASRILNSVSYDRSIIRRDRSRAVFAQSFLKFSGRMISANRMKVGAARLKKYAKLFNQIEREYGVPGPVMTAFWGLETDFGANTGDSPILGALATLAYDCRRSEMFQEQLIAAMKLIDRGDLSRKQMIGAWAGELGQTQFLPSHYLEFGVDYDGDGHVDLRKSVPDVMASTANLIRHYGWRAGEPWLQEVSVPGELPWEEADLTIRHPRAKWAAWGVRIRGGKSLPADNVPTALILPMGRKGPAFLAYPNFDVYTQWNQSLIYTTTAAYYATRLAGAPRYDRGEAGIPEYDLKTTIKLQELLSREGYDVGDIDGIMGAKTRKAVREAQQKYGLPADSYPTNDLFRRLRGS
ncbi:MAG: lytic murein transglycosylase [Hyphomicrobiales bacterium]|nr:lytic murein transglycosylase [Hyphomicrobiales bacterium]